jgi:hypothetical protein
MGRARGAATHAATTVGRRQAHRQRISSVPDLKIQFDKNGFSRGRYVVNAPEKESIDLVRNALILDDRALVLHGPSGSGKTALAEQVAAILRFPLVELAPTTAETAQEVVLGVEDRSYKIQLGREQIDAIKTLSGPVVLRVSAENAQLQTALADALRQDVSDGLRMTTFKNGQPTDSSIVSISQNALAIFEVSANPEDEHTTALPFSAPSEQVLARRAGAGPYEGGTWAEPVQVEADDAEDTEPDAHDDGIMVKRVVAAMDAVAPVRDTLISNLQTQLVSHNPDLASEDGRSFVEHWLTNVELQAYNGDNRAERTLALTLLGVLPPPVRKTDPGTRAIFGDALTLELQTHVDALFDAGDAARSRQR